MRTAPLGAVTGACHRFHDIVVQLSHSVVLQYIHFVELQLQFPTSFDYAQYYTGGWRQTVSAYTHQWPPRVNDCSKSAQPAQH